ncbi:MAG: AI-2E family transporter [Bacteroidota bacterium]
MPTTNISRYIVIGLTIITVAILLYLFRTIVMYVLISWVLAQLGYPISKFIQKKVRVGKFRAGPNLGAAVTILIYFIVFSLLVSMFIPLIVKQTTNLASVNYEAVAASLEEPTSQIANWMQEKGVDPSLLNINQTLSEAFSQNFNPQIIANFFSRLVGAAGSIFFALFSIVFITFFFLKERGLFMNFMMTLLPDKYEKQIFEIFDDSSHLLTRYFAGILLQITVITLYVWILLSIFGVQNALLIALFAAFINVIPYLGPLLGAIFGVFITITSNLDLDFYNEMLPLIVKVLIIFSTMQMIDNFILQPFIFSNSVLAHPLEIFLVILMGAQLYGIVGMVLAIPSYTVFRVIAKEFLIKFKIVQRLTNKMREVVD